MAQTHIVRVPLNRVEGDLDVTVEIADGMVVDAWCSGTMFRGIEQILVGRAAWDSLVITPRVCGICGTAHLTAASRALDHLADAKVPGKAVRVRNIALMAEHVQSDIRHACLTFLCDFTDQTYKDTLDYQEAVRRYQPFKGAAVVETIRETKKVLEIVAILGGQWPHSSYMVPGGVVSLPDGNDLLQCLHLLTRYRAWYEQRILGCSLERWAEVRSRAELGVWLDETSAHREGELGFFLRFARQVGLDRLGKGHGNFITFGAFDMPGETRVKPMAEGRTFVPAGFARGTRVEAFDHEKITEHIAHSWFEGYEGGRHPFDGQTRPYASGRERDKYSWAKAPRYDGLPAETGPLAEMVTGRQPLYVDLVENDGPNVLVRELARLARPALLLPAMEGWLRELLEEDGHFYNSPGEITEGVGMGLTQAARGALGHWVKVRDGRIVHYQIITPTAWHASPRDSAGIRGVFEEALVGTPVRDEKNPIELGHVVRSFDACLVCTVHALHKGERTGRMVL
jgi:Ni,Fe-hydrogenase I large subunit